MHWINHCAMFCEIHPRNGLVWGNVTDKQQLIDAVNALPMTTDNMINASRVAQAFQKFYTDKMPARANLSLVRLWALCSRERIRRYKWQTPSVTSLKAQTS